MKKIFSAGVVCLFLSQPVFGANNEIDLEIAQTMIDGGQAREALNFLKIDLDQDSTNSKEWFILAAAAQASNRPREAKTYLEKIVEIDPQNAGRAKLELAQLSYSLGDEKESVKHLNDVKKMTIPPQVGANIDQFLEHIKEHGAPKNWNLTFSTGWMYDTNANAGPDDRSVLMYGLPFTLPASSRSNEDNAFLAKLGFNHNGGITDDVGWQSSISVNYTDYMEQNHLDTITASASTGPTVKAAGRIFIAAPVIVDGVRYGNDEAYASYSYGTAPN